MNAASESGAVNKWVVLQEFSRFALYEGTYRKYHDELNLAGTASEFLNKAYQAAERIMNEGGFQIHITGKLNEDYASLFFSQNLEGNKEVILARYYTNNILNGSYWPEMFGNYEYYLLRDMVQAYLMQAGKLLERKPEGIYFSGLGKHDMTGDGVPDLILLAASESIPETRETNSLGAVLRY